LMYEYQATLVSDYDGDTMTVKMVVKDIHEDLGFGIFMDHRQTEIAILRLYGVNSPEIKAPGPEGEQARDWLRQWMTDHVPNGQFTVNTFRSSGVNPLDKKEKYGRYLAIV